MAEYKLTFGEPQAIVVDNLPLSNWTIVNTNTLSINGDTVTQLGVGGWYESMFVSFIVPETGSYKISYDYNITNAKVGNHGTYGFGLWLTTNNPNVSGDAQYNFYLDTNNHTGGIIGNQGEVISGKTGTIRFNANLTAGTTYYLWYPGAALDDGTTYTLSFTNIRIYNNPIKYNYNNLLVFPGWEGFLSYNSFEPHFEYTTLWETSNPFQNMYSITLNDSIDNYDELIVYGSANRDNSHYINCENTYVVDKNAINFCNSFYNGCWSVAANSHILCNGTQLLLSGTSGRVTSSYFMGQDAGSTAWCGWKATTARVQDVHPYKIVGVNYVQ